MQKSKALADSGKFLPDVYLYDDDSGSTVSKYGQEEPLGLLLKCLFGSPSTDYTCANAVLEDTFLDKEMWMVQRYLRA